MAVWRSRSSPSARTPSRLCDHEDGLDFPCEDGALQLPQLHLVRHVRHILARDADVLAGDLLVYRLHALAYIETTSEEVGEHSCLDKRLLIILGVNAGVVSSGGRHVRLQPNFFHLARGRGLVSTISPFSFSFNRSTLQSAI